MADFSGPGFLVAPGRERPDFTLFDFPDATVTNGSTEEIEFDQALSLAGRFGRDFLGVQVSGMLAVMVAEHLTSGSATDHEQTARVTLATRTGAFVQGDPELIWEKDYSAALAIDLGATDTANTVINFAPSIFETIYSEPFLYVAPRLFWRFANNLDVSVTAGQLDVRIASISVRLTFPIFIELLERFADVTLL